MVRNLEFNHARIFDGNGNIVQEGTEQSHSLSLMSTTLINHTFDINGFSVSLKGTTNSLHAEVSKQLKVGGLLYANAALDNLQIQYKWDKDEDKIQYGYLKSRFYNFREHLAYEMVCIRSYMVIFQN